MKKSFFLDIESGDWNGHSMFQITGNPSHLYGRFGMQIAKTDREIALEKKVKIAEIALKRISEFHDEVIVQEGKGGGVYIGALAKDIAFVASSEMAKVDKQDLLTTEEGVCL